MTENMMTLDDIERQINGYRKQICADNEYVRSVEASIENSKRYQDVYGDMNDQIRLECKRLESMCNTYKRMITVRNRNMNTLLNTIGRAVDLLEQSSNSEQALSIKLQIADIKLMLVESRDE